MRAQWLKPQAALMIAVRELDYGIRYAGRAPARPDGRRCRMEKIAETWITAPKRPAIRRPLKDACLVHIYPTGPTMGSRYPLTDKTIAVGRGEDCAIQIHDHSVSRRHARIEHCPDGFYVHDLQSTNGTFVNDRSDRGKPCSRDGDYLRVGNCIYRFLTGGNVEAEYHEEIYRLTIIDGLTQIHNQALPR